MTNDLHSASTLTGTVTATDGRGGVRMEDHYATDIDDLWSAITEPQRLGRWVADVRGDLRRGGAFEAAFTSGWSGSGRVDVCEPPRRLQVTMDPGQPEETVIEAVLRPESGGTRLVIEERGFPLAELAAHGAGWQAHVEDLAFHLAGREPGDWPARWRELTPAYERQAADLD